MSSPPPARLVRTLYRELLRAARVFDRRPGLKGLVGPGLLDAGYGLADKILPGKLIYFLPHNVPSFESLVRGGFRRTSTTTSTPRDGEAWVDADASEPRAPARVPLSDDLSGRVDEAFAALKYFSTLIHVAGDSATEASSHAGEAIRGPTGELFEASSPRPGTFLLSHPQLDGSSFERKVVLVLDYRPAHGTVGVIINPDRTLFSLPPLHRLRAPPGSSGRSLRSKRGAPPSPATSGASASPTTPSSKLAEDVQRRIAQIRETLARSKGVRLSPGPRTVVASTAIRPAAAATAAAVDADAEGASGDSHREGATADGGEVWVEASAPFPGQPSPTSSSSSTRAPTSASASSASTSSRVARDVELDRVEHIQSMFSPRELRQRRRSVPLADVAATRRAVFVHAAATSATPATSAASTSSTTSASSSTSRPGDPAQDLSIPVLAGGPIACHPFCLHRRPDVKGSLVTMLPAAPQHAGVRRSREFTQRDPLFMNGSPLAMRAAVEAGSARADDFVFFASTSEWGPGQLDRELQEGAWVVVQHENPWAIVSEALGRPSSYWGPALFRPEDGGVVTTATTTTTTTTDHAPTNDEEAAASSPQPVSATASSPSSSSSSSPLPSSSSPPSSPGGAGPEAVWTRLLRALGGELGALAETPRVVDPLGASDGEEGPEPSLVWGGGHSRGGDSGDGDGDGDEEDGGGDDDGGDDDGDERS